MNCWACLKYEFKRWTADVESKVATGKGREAGGQKPQKRSLLMNRPANRQQRSLMKIMKCDSGLTLRWKAGLKS